MNTSLSCPLCRSRNVITGYRSIGSPEIQRHYGKWSIEFQERKCLEENCGYFCNQGSELLSEDSKDWKDWERSISSFSNLRKVEIRKSDMPVTRFRALCNICLVEVNWVLNSKE